MSSRKQLPDVDGKLVGRRIKACRVLTGFNQEEFSTRHGFALPSLKTWELGVIPRVEGISRLIEAFKKDGVFVANQWLMWGHGIGPSFNLEQAEQGGGDERMWQTFRNECIKSHDNPIISEIIDDEMMPYFSMGDVLFGKLFDVATMLNDSHMTGEHRPLLVRMESGHYEPRWVHFIDNTFFIRSIKTPYLRKIEHPSFAKILWHQTGG